MSIQNPRRVCGPYACNGQTTQFPFDFKVFSGEQVIAVLGDALDREVPLVFGKDYSVEFNSDQDSRPGGIVRTSVAQSAVYRIMLTSGVPNTQPDTLINLGGFYPKVIERALDRLEAQIQQVDSIAQRSMRVPLFSQAKPEDLLQEFKADARAATAASVQAHRWADRATVSAKAAEQYQMAASASAYQASVDALHAVGLGGTDAYGGISNLDDPTLPAGLYYSRLGKAEGNWSGFGFLLHKIYDTAGFQLANVYGSGVLRFRERANNVWLKPITLANLNSPAFTGTPRADTPAAGDDSDRLATTHFVARGFPPVYSIASLPARDLGPILIREFGDVWIWVNDSRFTGYRSPNCGEVAYFYDRTNVRPGWLKANGARVSRTTYAGLYSIVGDMYSGGDGAMNFVLPDLRGEFIRGSDDGRGLSKDSITGSNQAATAIRGLIDNYIQYPVGGYAIGMRNVDGILKGQGSDNYTVGSNTTFYIGPATANQGADDNESFYVRPRNVALMPYIKI